MRSSTTHHTVVHAIAESVKRWPQRAALVFGDETLSYAALAQRVERTAATLIDSGVRDGDRVAVLSANHPDVVVCALAAMHAGATWVPANHRDAPHEICTNLLRVDCAMLAHSDEMAAMAAAVSEQADGRLQSTPLAEIRGTRRSTTIRATPQGHAAIFFTGGTTGRPKGVVFTHRNFRNLIDHYVELVVAPDERMLIAGPLTHVAGRQCVAALATGATTVILPAFDAGAVLEAIEQHRITAMTTSPTMLYKLLDHPAIGKRDLRSLRRLGYGAAPIALERLKQAIRTFGPLLQGSYGQTESPMLISCLRPEEHVDIHGALADDYRLRSVGRPTAVSDVKIVDPHGGALPVGEIGEIVVAGDYQMDGYFDDPAATTAARLGDHIRTGDLGFLDNAGYLTIVGRIKDMIITGGFNVYAAEVENVLAGHPAVYEAAVFGLGDPVWGESVCAAVQLRTDGATTSDELRTWARQLLGGVKSPKRIEIVPEIPRNTNGKILKRALIERFAVESNHPDQGL